MRNFNITFNAIFAIAAVLIVGQFVFLAWLAVKSVDAVQNGTGVKDLVETVWCGSDNGTGVDCVKPEVTE